MNSSASLGDSVFKRALEFAPDLYLLLTPDFRIIEASNAYLSATLTRREAILGKGIFEVFPDNPDDPSADGVRKLRASLERARSTRRPDIMAFQRYDVPRPNGRGFEVKYWSPRNTPVLNAAGEVEALIHRVEDVTEKILAARTERPAVDDTLIADIFDDEPMADLAGNIGEEGMKQVYAMYLADAEKLLVRMHQGVKNGELAAVVDSAHQLKATSGSVGATQVSKKSSEFEELARTGGPGDWEAMLRDVETAFRLVEIELKRRLRSGK